MLFVHYFQKRLRTQKLFHQTKLRGGTSTKKKFCFTDEIKMLIIKFSITKPDEEKWKEKLSLTRTSCCKTNFHFERERKQLYAIYPAFYLSSLSFYSSFLVSFKSSIENGKILKLIIYCRFWDRHFKV